MGRQPFRQMTSDGTREEASSASAGGSGDSAFLVADSGDKSYPFNPYFTNYNTYNTANVMNNGNTLFWAIPCYLPCDGVIDAVTLWSHSMPASGTTTLRIAIYNADGTSKVNQPRTEVAVGTATFTSSSTANAQQIVAFDSSATITAGWYWLIWGCYNTENSYGNWVQWRGNVAGAYVGAQGRSNAYQAHGVLLISGQGTVTGGINNPLTSTFGTSQGGGYKPKFFVRYSSIDTP